tara:strand:- start:88 stop:423 length:336 start_codon:yes stop_codon:yes gene_type:complete
MILNHYTYFNALGRYRGNMNLFVPEGDEVLHTDGISIVKGNGEVYLQKNHPEAKWGSEGLTRVDGVYNGEYELFEGAPRLLPAITPTASPNSIEDLWAILKAKSVVSDTDI